MPVLDRGLPIDDRWTDLADDQPLPADGAVIVSLERWRTDREALTSRGAAVGVRLKSSQLATEIAGDLGSLSLVALELPKFRDGRAFSAARELRERFGYKGEIRAFGHIIPDQYLFLTRVGVDTVVVPEDKAGPAWAQALKEMSIAYQPALEPDAPVSLLRRHLKGRVPA
ncbi:DUF934 domain-containing protein [Niveispirillum fermenti]|uniref:DUF934 domain-containing protein n=1 Tax=Niveispirillum fermenti TaxID=1233113 RepID=UPI003A873301